MIETQEQFDVRHGFRPRQDVAQLPGWAQEYIEDLEQRLIKVPAPEAVSRARALAAAPGSNQALASLPAIASKMFFWPVSDGTTRAALTITLDRGRLTARITGMRCQSAAPEPAGTWVPGTYAEVDITGLRRKVAAARIRAAVRRLVRRGH